MKTLTVSLIVDLFWSVIEAIVSPDKAQELYGVRGLHSLPEPNLYDAQ